MQFNAFSIPKGALTEISGAPGAGKTETALRFLAENPEGRVAWIERNSSIYPCAFPQQGVSLDRVFFVDVPGGMPENVKELFWICQQAIASQVFKTVVVSFDSKVLDLIILRRLQLAAEKNQVSVLFLTDSPLAGITWPIHLRLEARRGEQGRVQLQVLKHRGQSVCQFQSA